MYAQNHIFNKGGDFSERHFCKLKNSQIYGSKLLK